jgi:hypothetical protein
MVIRNGMINASALRGSTDRLFRMSSFYRSATWPPSLTLDYLDFNSPCYFAKLMRAATARLT